MSWSNVPDYMHPDDFHAVARACSGTAETVHFMHTMNWWAPSTVGIQKIFCFNKFAGDPWSSWKHCVRVFATSML
jgi:hypothetical protein